MTKAEQLQSNRLRPKPDQKNKSKEIKNKAFMSWCHAEDLPCFICGRHGYIELHHIKGASMDVKDDTKVIPVCGNECHRLGTKLSVHGTPKVFREVYPLKVQLCYAEDLYDRFKGRL